MNDLDTPKHETTIPHPRELPNLSRNERYGSIASGIALILLGLARRRLSGLLLGATGAALLARGSTGKCSLYRSLGLSTARSQRPGVPDNLGTKVERSITIRRSPEDIYRFWRNLQNLPRFMQNLQKVESIGGNRSHWVAIGPGGRSIEWDAEIINEHPNELIAWESLPGSELENAGSVRFRPAPGARGTEVRICMQFNPTRGLLGMLAAKLKGESPETQVEEDLIRLKQLLETGEITTAASRPTPHDPLRAQAPREKERV
jgi:uncharacterized membrane protein